MRLRVPIPLLVALILMSLLSVPMWAQTELTGQTDGGAFFKISVPDGWTPADGLVIWNHGFSLSPIAPDPDLGPLIDVQLAQGYAVAASSYSLTGWAVFETHLDNSQMYQVFEDNFGRPDSVIVTGASLGGIVTARDLEEGLIPNITGAMPICGALTGSRTWDAAVDLRLLYDLVCGEVPGAAIPGGANGLPFPPDPNFDNAALGLAINACFGLPAVPSADQAARLGQFLALTAIPVEFIGTDMGFVTFGLADLVFDPRKLAGASAFDNANVDYGDPLVNGAIDRVTPDQEARRKLVDNYTPTGNVGDAKIVSLHTDKDGLVIVENESSYAAAVPASQLTTAIVVEDTPSHCGFSEAEVLATWESLRGWLGGLPQPTAAGIQAACNGIVIGGLAEGPCRIDPGFVIPNISDRIRPRSVCVPDADTLCLGNAGRFQMEVAWEDFDGNTGNGQAGLVTTADTGSFWFFGPDNVELVVKSIDGRQNNGNFWVFFGSLTNVSFDLTVTDTQTSLTKTYRNGFGNFASVGDTDAF